MIHYRGQRRDGMASTGVSDESAAVLAERLFDQRWRWVELVRDGEVVGAVLTHTDGGTRNARTWWAES